MKPMLSNNWSSTHLVIFLNAGITNSSDNNPYSSIPNVTYNDYIPQVPVNNLGSAELYKQSIFNERVKWIQKRIDGLYDLSSSIFR